MNNPIVEIHNMIMKNYHENEILQARVKLSTENCGKELKRIKKIKVQASTSKDTLLELQEAEVELEKQIAECQNIKKELKKLKKTIEKSNVDFLIESIQAGLLP